MGRSETPVARLLQLPGETVGTALRQVSMGMERRAPGRLIWLQDGFQGERLEAGRRDSEAIAIVLMGV